MSSITDKIVSVTRRIEKARLQAGRKAQSVRLLAVSKTRHANELREAAAAGQQDFGENYVQEALDKIADLQEIPGLRWHFIGPVQSNKTAQIASAFCWVHSVDRLKIARRLNDQRDPQLPPLNICLQVNIDNEASKSGCTLGELPALAAAVGELTQLSLRGLMAIPDPERGAAKLRESFRAMNNALIQLRQEQPGSGPLDTLSMGMSGDMELAIEEGATWVRVGTAVFGPRPQKS